MEEGWEKTGVENKKGGGANRLNERVLVYSREIDVYGIFPLISETGFPRQG
jgi:hypothetical protein